MAEVTAGTRALAELVGRWDRIEIVTEKSPQLLAIVDVSDRFPGSANGASADRGSSADGGRPGAGVGYDAVVVALRPGAEPALPSAVGPEPVVRLQIGGLKVGELLSRGMPLAEADEAFLQPVEAVTTKREAT